MKYFLLVVYYVLRFINDKIFFNLVVMPIRFLQKKTQSLFEDISYKLYKLYWNKIKEK